MTERIVVIGGLGSIAVLVLLYFTGVLPEHIAALFLAAAVVLGAVGYAFRHLRDEARTSAENAMCIGLCAATALLAGVPIVTTLIPGSPAAKGSIHAAGDSIALPSDVRGAIRILMHGRVGGQGVGDTEIVLGVGQERVSSHFVRKQQSVRMGRRGRSTVMREQNTRFLSINVPGNVDQLRVEKVNGSLAGPVDVEIFRELLPESLALIIGMALLILTGVLAVRFGVGSGPVGAIGVVVFFAYMIHHIATPEVAIQPEMGSLVIGGVGGMVAGSIVSWLCKKVVKPSGARPQSSAAQSG